MRRPSDRSRAEFGSQQGALASVRWAAGCASLHVEDLFKFLAVRVGRDLLDQPLPVKVGLDLLEHDHLLLVVDHVKRRALAPKPAGPADAVQVGVRVGRAALAHGHVVVDHERHRGHVDAAREDVGRDEEACGAVAEVDEHFVARPCLHPAVQRRDGVSVRGERVRQLLDRVAQVHEDDALADVDNGEDLSQPLELLRHAVRAVEVLRDLVVENVLALHLDLRPRVVH
mmetsp:Transcript_9136/g.28733  ORF Transcript_9136/g.28733 Transcript_9136/m.28733 type:complete len:228 (-) Transcript_9136:808-1491(-)